MGHTWSYVPDVARTVLELLDESATLEPFATFHMKGHSDALAPFVTTFREMGEMRYLWRDV